MSDIKKDRDVALKHVTLGKWFVLGAGIIAVAALLIWIFFGEITSVLRIKGVVAGEEKPLEVYMGEGGYIIHQNYWIGDWVEAGSSILEYVPYTALKLGKPGELSHEELDSFEISIQSPYDGYVVDTYVGEGQKGLAMTPVASIGKMDDDITVLALVRDSELGSISEGMQVRVKPVMYPTDKYGYLMGSIKKIHYEFITREELVDYVGQNEIVDTIMEGFKESYMIVVSIDTDTAGRPIWHGAKKGENDAKLRFGMICDMDVITETFHPYTYLFGE